MATQDVAEASLAALAVLIRRWANSAILGRFWPAIQPLCRKCPGSPKGTTGTPAMRAWPHHRGPSTFFGLALRSLWSLWSRWSLSSQALGCHTFTSGSSAAAGYALAQARRKRAYLSSK